MSLEVSLSQKDIKRLKDNLQKMLKNDRKEVIRIVQGGALIAETVAAQASPVDTGRLRQSIRKKNINGFSAKISTNVKYARFQNDGTSRGIKAKKFMEKGFEAGREYIIKKLG